MAVAILIAFAFQSLVTADDDRQRDQAVNAARQDARVSRILETRERIEFTAEFNEQLGGWIVDIVAGEQKLGSASVKGGEVVELDLKKTDRRETRSPVEWIETDRRVRELRERFPEAIVVLAGGVRGEWRAFEVVVDNREVTAGEVNVESGVVRLRDKESTETRAFEREAATGFWHALLQTCRFPVEGNGLVWFAAVVTLVAVFPFHRPLSMQSIDVLVILSIFPVSLVVWEHTLSTYLALFVLTAYLLSRCLHRSFQRTAATEPPNLRAAMLSGALVIVIAAHLQAIFTRGPDDSGIWTVFGGQFVWEHGRLPYGQIGEGGTYGPVMYAIAAPLTHLAPPTAALDGPGERIVVNMHNLQEVGYQNCDFLPAKILALAFDGILLFGLVAIGRQEVSWEVGLTLALVYAVGGLTIQRDLLFVSHLGPTAFVILAIAARNMPTLSGLLLAIGAGVLFWPAFLIPTWLAYYAARGRAALVRSGLAIAIVGVAIIATIHFYTAPVGERGPLKVFAANTWEHQEGGGPYSHSEFGLWGQWIERNPEQAAAISTTKQLVRWTYFTLCLLLPAALFFLRKPMPFCALLGISASLALGLQFWKTHGGGLYTGWYFPLVVATLLIPTNDTNGSTSQQS